MAGRKFKRVLMARRKAKRVCVKRSTRGEDLISKLPDSLISQILSCLPTKEALKTCVLSKRWQSLWLSVPSLVLDSSEFPNHSSFVGFTENFIDFSIQENSCLQKLKLSIHRDSESCFKSWLDFVATPKLEHLDVECHLAVKRDSLEMVPVKLYICESLVYLRLHGVLLKGFEFVSLPLVKTMRLEHNIYADEASMELLISSCRVLDVLSIVRRIDDNVKVLRVRSQTLCSLSIELGWVHGQDDNVAYRNDYHGRTRGVLIDAPRLEYLNLDECLSLNKTSVNTSSLANVILVNKFDLTGSAYEVHKFFTSISGVTNMKISSDTFAIIAHIIPYTPRFCNLARLEGRLHYYNMQNLLKFLKSCPNLKSLSLDLYCSTVWEADRGFEFVPKCLLSSLEFVEIMSPHWHPILLELATHFAGNSAVLKELSLVLSFSELDENDVALRDLLAFLALPTRSSTCQITVSDYKLRTELPWNRGC